MSEPMFISLARACQASDASQNEKILAGIVLQQHAELEALKRVNQDNINSFHSAIVRAEKAEAEVDRLRAERAPNWNALKEALDKVNL